MRKTKINNLKKALYESSSWMIVIFVILGAFGFVVLQRASAATSGKMILFFHKEASDANETYNSLSFAPPEPGGGALTAPGTLTSTTNVNATPPTAFCEATDGQTDVQNERIASAASTGNRCLGTFISQPMGNAISMSTGDTNAISTQVWSSESATQAAVALNVYIYRCSTSCISSSTLTSTDRIATVTCAEPGTSATACSTSSTPANNITFAATDRIVAVVSSNVTTLRSGADTRFYFDNSSNSASITLKYTALGYNTSNKPSLTGNLDDDFTQSASSTCTTAGVAYNTKWNCLLGSACTSSAVCTGAIDAEDLGATGVGQTSSWLRLSNTTASTSLTTSDFGTTPSNTFIYQTMPTSYGDGNIRTLVNTSGMFGVGASSPTTPFNHVGLVLWTSNTDFLELQIYSTSATTGTNSVVVALNNSNSLGTTTSLNSTTTSGIFGEVWLGFSNTGGTWQAQYSTDGTTWNNVSSSVAHTTAFTRVGLNAFAKIANPINSYGGGFEWFSYGLSDPTYNQTSFEFFDNANSTTPGTAHGNNTNYTLTSTGAQFRLRQLVHSNGQNGASSNFSNVLAQSEASGIHGAVVVGSDGLPRLFDVNGSHAIFTQCTNVSCSKSNLTTISTDLNQNRAEIMMGNDGFARLLYSDSTTQNLKYVQCTNASCSTNTQTGVTASLSPIEFSMVLGSDGFARIAYSNSSNLLALITCTNDSCSASSSVNINTIDLTNDPRLAIGQDTFPRMTYYDIGNLHYVQCTNTSCSTNNDTTVDTINATHTALGIASDGFARIAYAKTSTSTDYIQCTNASCSTNVKNTVDGSNKFTDGVLGSDSLMRFVSLPSNTIKITTCTVADCSSSTNMTFSVTSPAAGLDTRLALSSVNGAFVSTAENSAGLYLVSQTQLFKLQYAAQGSGCSSASYSDITSSSPISFYKNATPATGDSITYQAGTDPTEVGQTVNAETFQEDPVPLFAPASFGYTVDGEWDFSLFDNGASASTAYCLRLAQDDGTAFTTYTNYPVITMYAGAAGPTTDQILRGGKWFNASGVKQSYFWAN